MAKQQNPVDKTTEVPPVINNSQETASSSENLPAGNTEPAKEIAADTKAEGIISPDQIANEKEIVDLPYLNAILPTASGFVDEKKESAFYEVEADHPIINMQLANGPITIKPVLSDELVQQDFSQSSTVKIQNEQGVTVNLSGTAAGILKSLDAKTKIVG